jgi:DNA mismatch repair ATPase MutS
VPRDVLDRAKAILADIERDAEDLAPRIARRSPRARAGDAVEEKEKQLGLFEPKRSAVEKELERVDIDRLTPIEALLLLRELKQLLP